VTTNVRDVIIVAALVIQLLAAWSLRPRQRRATSPRLFIGREKDSMYQMLFKPDGLPRKYSWCVPIVWALPFVVAAYWFLPTGAP
jgi:hypothetical protein